MKYRKGDIHFVELDGESHDSLSWFGVLNVCRRNLSIENVDTLYY